MKKAVYLFIILMFFPVLASGQNELRKGYLDYRVNKNRDEVYYKGFRGTPYENSDFSEALIYTIGYSTPQKAQMRYNLCFDEMEMKVEGKQGFMILANEKMIDSIILNGIVYKYLAYSLKGKNNNGYLEVLVSGGVNLYARKSKAIQEEKMPASGYEEYQPPSIVNNPELFFVQFAHDPLELLPSTPKKIISYMQKKGYDLAAFVKTEKLKYDDESITRLVSYCSKWEKIPSKK